MACAFLSFPKYGFILFQHIFEYIEVTLVEKEKTIFFENTSFFAMMKKKKFEETAKFFSNLTKMLNPQIQEAQ